MSYIDIENDILNISTSPIFSFNFFQKKFYRLYQLLDNKNEIIINGSFLFNEISDLNKINNNTKFYYKNVEKLYINIKNINFYINIDKLEIENNNYNINDILYQTNIIQKKNNKYKDFIILIDNPIIINICYNIKNLSNHVSISSFDDISEGGTKKLYNKNIDYLTNLDI
jgi:hypothetical protein